jgi:uncharacterized protein (UPF0261 family)
LKDTKLLIVGMALISALMLVMGAIAVIPTAIAIGGGRGTDVDQSIGQLLPIGVISDVNHTILAR